jgi:hypothetical protein
MIVGGAIHAGLARIDFEAPFRVRVDDAILLVGQRALPICQLLFALLPHHLFDGLLGLWSGKDFLSIAFRKRRDLFSGRDGQLPLVDSCGEIAVAAFDDLARASHATLADIRQLGGLRLRNLLNWRFKRQICRLIGLPVAAMADVCEPRRDHGALRFIELTPAQIKRDHIGNRIAAVENLEHWVDARLNAGPITIAPVKNGAIIELDLLA